jgi:O-antigen/teichoic acid export membrane protein
MPADSFGFLAIFRRLKMHPALRDLGVVGASGFITAIAGMLVISVVGKAFGAALLGEYLLIRRMASWLQAGVQLPSGVALPRYVSASLDDPNSPKLAYFVSALLAACGIGLLTCFVLLVWRHRISGVLFGSSALDHLVLPLGVLLMGFAVHGAVYGYLQGILKMGRASALQLCDLAVFPLGTALVLRSYHSVSLLVTTSSILMIICACSFAFPFLRKGNFLVSLEKLKRHGYELISYGYSRVAHDFGLQALLSLPAVIAAHYFPMSSVGYLLLAGSFLTMVAAGTLPLAIILLSRVSRSIAQTGTDQLKTRVCYFVSALIELSVFICLQMILFADVFVRFWVGPSFLEGIRAIQIAILAVPFYFIHAGLRGVIDAASIKAYNAWNVCIAVAGFLVCVGLVQIFVPHAQLLEGLAAAGVMGMVILACCSTWTVMKLFEINLDWARLTPGICVGLLFGGLSFWLHDVLQYQPSLMALVAYEIALTATYLLVLGLINPPWVRFFRSNMLTYSSQQKEKPAISG